MLFGFAIETVTIDILDTLAPSFGISVPLWSCRALQFCKAPVLLASTAKCYKIWYCICIWCCCHTCTMDLWALPWSATVTSSSSLQHLLSFCTFGRSFVDTARRSSTVGMQTWRHLEFCVCCRCTSKFTRFPLTFWLLQFLAPSHSLWHHIVVDPIFYPLTY